MKRIWPILVILIFVSLSLPAYSQEIFLWDKDLGETFDDPEGGGIVGSEYAVEQALTSNGYTYTMDTLLPGDLSGYDIVFVIMGAHC